jgi:hypothetical protein
LRGALTAAELKTMDADKAFKLINERRWTRLGDRAADMTLGSITLRKPRAIAELVVNGEPTNTKLEFVEVDQKWVINSQCMDEWKNRWIKVLGEFARQSEDDVILAIAGGRVGKELHRSIWEEPPK